MPWNAPRPQAKRSQAEMKQVATIVGEDGEFVTEVEVSNYDRLRDMKAKLVDLINIPVEEQELRHKGRLLKDDTSMAPLLLEVDLTFTLLQGFAAKIAALGHVRMGGALTGLDPEFRGDRDVVFAAACENVVQLQHASLELRSDPEFMAMCVNVKTTAMYYTAVDLWGNPDFVRACLQGDGTLLQNAHPEMRADFDIVKLAVENAAHALQFAAPSMRDNKEIVLASVAQKGTALKWASPRLKNDRDVVLTAVRNDKVAFVHASRSLKEDPEVEEAKEAQRGDIVQRPQGARKNLVKQKFRALDKNGDGYLDYEELKELLAAGNPNIADWEVRLLFETVDKSKDNRVEFEEFCDFVFAQDPGLSANRRGGA